MTSENHFTIETFNQRHPSNASKSLQLLFEYTKFHIGVYLTMTSAYIGLATFEVNKKLFFEINGWFLALAILMTVIAGLAGGVIISSTTLIESNKTSDFLTCKIGPWNFQTLQLPAQRWIYIEHTSFWIGLLSAMLSLLANKISFINLITTGG